MTTDSSPRGPGAAAPVALPFEYGTADADPVREDLVVAHRRAWERLARAGTWWTGRERVAIAAEARAAAYCGLCRERRNALSPFGAPFGAPSGLGGEHDQVSAEILSGVAIDTIHRLVTDASRLTATWHAGLAEAGLPDTHYVELLSVIVELVSIDGFHRAMGLAPEPLPSPLPGEPPRRRPEAAVAGEAWVPMLPAGRPSGDEADLWGAVTGNVIRAMSLVPDAVRGLNELSAAHYLEPANVADPLATRGTLSRAQTELIAGRVSALNECFY